MSGAPDAPASLRLGWGALAGVLVISTCLRPALTSVGPVLPDIGAEFGLGTAALGLLGTIPLLCFAAASPLVHALTTRTGQARAVTLCLAGIAAAIALRSLPLPGALWAGTVLAGLAIAVGNVVVSGLVKRSFAARVALATGLYSAVMGAAASLASGLSVPLATALGGWRAGLAAWVVPTLVALVVWWFGSARSPAAPAVRAPRAGSPWRSALAWQVTGFFGLQSLVFYLLVTWLPTMAIGAGLPASEAGWLLFCFQAVGVVSGPVLAGWADRVSDQRWLCAATGLAMAVAATGVVLAPTLVWWWAVLAGASAGASFSLALALSPLRTRSSEDTVRLSGMSQAVGYLVAAAGPVAAGWLAQAAGWGVVLVAVAVIAVAQAVLGGLAGASRLLSGTTVVPSGFQEESTPGQDLG